MKGWKESMFLKKIMLAISILMLSFLTACSQNTERHSTQKIKFLPQTDPQWQSHLSKLQQIKKYSINGQLGYLTAKKRVSTAFQWNYQSDTDYQLNLSSTLNLVNMSLRMTPEGLFLTNNDGETYYIHSLNQFLKAQFGFDIPLKQLTTWLKGEPLQGQDYLVGSNHLLAEFTYQINNMNWRVRYLSYTQDSLPMPEILQLDNGKQTIKIKITNWIL